MTQKPETKAPAPEASYPGAMPSINEPEGSQIYSDDPAQAPDPQAKGPEVHRLDNDPKLKHDADTAHGQLKHGDDDDDDDGGTTRSRTTTVTSKHKR